LLVFIHYTLALPSPANLNPALTFTLALPSAMLYPNPNHINPRNLSSNPSFCSSLALGSTTLDIVLRTPEALASLLSCVRQRRLPRPSSPHRRRPPRPRIALARRRHAAAARLANGRAKMVGQSACSLTWGHHHESESESESSQKLLMAWEDASCQSFAHQTLGAKRLVRM